MLSRVGDAGWMVVSSGPAVDAAMVELTMGVRTACV
jgi:hypothetical protein